MGNCLVVFQIISLLTIPFLMINLKRVYKIKLAGNQDKWDNFRDPRESHNEKHFDNGLQVGLLPLPGNLFTKKL